MAEEEADTVLERAACTEAVLVGASVQPAAVVAMLAHAESPLVKSVPLAGLAAVAEVPVQVLCLTWGAAREGTYRRQHTSTLGLEVILTTFDPEEISLASSQVVAC